MYAVINQQNNLNRNQKNAQQVLRDKVALPTLLVSLEDKLGSIVRASRVQSIAEAAHKNRISIKLFRKPTTDMKSFKLSEQNEKVSLLWKIRAHNVKM